METEQITAKDIQAELKAAMRQWKQDNPAPELNAEPEPEMPEPIVIKTDKQLIIVDAQAGDMLHLHVLDGHSTRKVELTNEQAGKLIEALHCVRRPMKIHRAWKNLYQAEVNRFDAQLALWNRQLMEYRDSVRRRLGYEEKPFSK